MNFLTREPFQKLELLITFVIIKFENFLFLTVENISFLREINILINYFYSSFCEALLLWLMELL